MTYCIVAPLQILEVLDRQEELGSTHLLLAHDIVKPENRERYRAIFNRPYRAKKNLRDNYFTHVILDNSVIETGKAADTDVIFQAAEIVRPGCIVLPDVLEDCDATIESCTRAKEEWDKKLRTAFPRDLQIRDTPFLYVPQGKTLKEFTKAAEALSRGSDRIRYWGVPRNLVKNIGTRRGAIETVRALNDRRYIHMLGFSDDLGDDFLCANVLEVDTIDSAVPLRFQNEFHLGATLGPRANWWDTATYTHQMSDNLKIARRYFG
jgi:hypothetical protein